MLSHLPPRVRGLWLAAARAALLYGLSLGHAPYSGQPAAKAALGVLLLAAALLPPRPPARVVLNAPVTSRHPALLPALGRLIAQAAQRSQVIVVSHAARLVASLEREPGSHSIVLEKELGATRIVDAHALEVPAWKWPAR